MPFGIIQVAKGGKLNGTELLIGDEREDIIPETEARQLKRILYKGNETILIPQPSDHDPNDPLLWARWRKETAFWVIFFNAIIFAILPGPMIAPSTFMLSKVFDVPLTSIAELSGYQLLVVGALGPVVSVLAQKYGKRPQFLLAAVVATIGTIICIVGSQQVNYNTLLAGRMVQGLGVTAWESLSLATVGDIYFLHERGWRTAILVAALACTASVVAVVSGIMTQSVGWQNLFVALLPFDVACLLSTIFLLPETQYKRAPIALHPVVTHENGDGEKTERQQEEETAVSGEGTHVTEHGTGTIRRKTYYQTLAPYTIVYTEKSILYLLAEIFVHLINPAVWWILLVSGVLISFFVVTAYILAQIWSVPPYLLNVAQNGYFFTGAFIGGLAAVFIGPICDWSARLLSKLNNGVFEAEFRIPINVFGAVCCSLGWFLFMWDVNHPRPDGYYLGAFCYGLVCFGISVPSTSAGLYILDSFPKQSTEIFVLQMMLKNFLFYGFSTFINTWAGREGAGQVFKVFGITSLALVATCIPMYIFGKLNRSFMSRVHRRVALFRGVE